MSNRKFRGLGRSTLGLILGLAAALCGGARIPGQAAPQDEEELRAIERADVGRVPIEASCSPAARADLERGVALLHALWHEAAYAAFTAAAGSDPRCALAYWGQAMSCMPALPDLEPVFSLERGRAALRSVRSLAVPTARERAYLEAVQAFFRDPADSLSVRLRRHSEATAALARAYPEDAEATAFYARSLLMLQSGGAFENQRRAAEVLVARFGPQPEHPGAAHYLVYAYDNSDETGDDLAAADHYAHVAPAVPRARHIPSHVYVRHGRFEEAARADAAAWAAWLAIPPQARHRLEFRTTALDAFHSLAWLAYSKLQRGQFSEALELLQVARREHEAAAWLQPLVRDMEARDVMERSAWAEALAIEQTEAADQLDGELWYVRGIAAARIAWPGARVLELALAQDAAARLDAIARRVPSETLELERLEVRAALAAAVEEQGEMEVLLAHAIALEDAVPNHGALPRPLLSVHELAGDLWFQVRRYDLAQREYGVALDRYPGRARALYGLARAAARAGDRTAATQAVTQLLEIWRQADRDRPELIEMRAIVDQ